VVFVTAKGTEPAAGDTDVGKVDVTVDIEIGIRAAPALLRLTCQSPETEEVGFLEKEAAVIGRKSFTAHDLLLDCVHTGLLIHRCNASQRVWIVKISSWKYKNSSSIMWKIIEYIASY
jgi:hypothetical protein